MIANVPYVRSSSQHGGDLKKKVGKRTSEKYASMWGRERKVFCSKLWEQRHIDITSAEDKGGKLGQKEWREDPRRGEVRSMCCLERQDLSKSELWKESQMAI